MKVHAHFIMVNSRYSQELADSKYEGKESPDNVKYWWEDEIATKTPITTLSEPQTVDFELKTEINGNSRIFIIPEVIKYDLIDENGEKIELAVSEKLLLNHELVKTDEERTDIYFYFKDDSVMSKPVPGQYFDILDFPKELKK